MPAAVTYSPVAAAPPAELSSYAKDYEVYAETSETFIYLAMIQFMLQRLASDPTKRPWNVPIAG